MGNRTPRPKHLATKLLAIRKSLGLSQFEMARLLKCDYYHRLSEFESGRRVPNMLVLLAYARAANIPLENIIDDEKEIS